MRSMQLVHKGKSAQGFGLVAVLEVVAALHIAGYLPPFGGVDGHGGSVYSQLVCFILGECLGKATSTTRSLPLPGWRYT